MSYIALRTQKVHTKSGQIVIRQPGDPIPEAADWPNVEKWIKHGWIRPSSQEAASATVLPKRNGVTAVDKDGNPIKEQKPVTKPAEEKPAEEPKAAEQPTEEIVEPDAPGFKKDELEKKTKSELVDLAADIGIDIDAKMKKSEMITVIMKHA